MTKQELLKKRGIKAGDELSPSEALLTKNPKENDKPQPKKPAAAKKSKEEKAPGAEVKKNPEITAFPENKEIAEAEKIPQKKNKGGRPKKRTEPYKILNIGVPVSVHEDVSQYALPLYENNMTVYINTLIKRDLDANIENYKQVSRMMQKAKGV